MVTLATPVVLAGVIIEPILKFDIVSDLARMVAVSIILTIQLMKMLISIIVSKDMRRIISTFIIWMIEMDRLKMDVFVAVWDGSKLLMGISHNLTLFITSSVYDRYKNLRRGKKTTDGKILPVEVPKYEIQQHVYHYKIRKDNCVLYLVTSVEIAKEGESVVIKTMRTGLYVQFRLVSRVLDGRKGPGELLRAIETTPLCMPNEVNTYKPPTCPIADNESDEDEGLPRHTNEVNTDKNLTCPIADNESSRNEGLPRHTHDVTDFRKAKIVRIGTVNIGNDTTETEVVNLQRGRRRRRGKHGRKWGR
jgi:hypothetical protein